MIPEALPVAVVVPTICRAAEVRSALESVVSCNPRPADTVVVYQSDRQEIAEAIECSAVLDAHRVLVPGRRRCRATNDGSEAAAHATVFVNNNACVEVRRILAPSQGRGA